MPAYTQWNQLSLQNIRNFGRNESTKLTANILTGAAVFNAIQGALIPNRRPDAFSSDFDSREFESRENIMKALTEKNWQFLFFDVYFFYLNLLNKIEKSVAIWIVPFTMLSIYVLYYTIDGAKLEGFVL